MQAQSVPFSIQVTRKVAFGESIKAVGNAPAFGDWDVGKGAALQWQEGHVWSAKFNLAIGKNLRFKVTWPLVLCWLPDYFDTGWTQTRAPCMHTGTLISKAASLFFHRLNYIIYEI